jgi:hypothetical protein
MPKSINRIRLQIYFILESERRSTVAIFVPKLPHESVAVVPTIEEDKAIYGRHHPVMPPENNRIFETKMVQLNTKNIYLSPQEFDSF